MSVSDKALSEIANTINGFEEMAIKKVFKTTWFSILKASREQLDDGKPNPDHDPFPMYRACIFIDKKRSGKPEAVALKETGEIPSVDLASYFAPEDAESGKE